MQKNWKIKKQYKVILILLCLTFGLTFHSYASEADVKIRPNIPNNIGLQWRNVTEIRTRENLIKQSFISNVEKFDLRDHIKIEVKNQERTGSCWLLAMSTVYETNLALQQDINVRLSSRHMDYATSTSFKQNQKTVSSFNKKVNTGGTAEMALSYLTNGSGPILEEEMPFSEQFPNIDITNITEKTAKFQLKDWKMFSNVYKRFEDGETIYLNQKQENYTKAQIEGIRNEIKQHIMTNGAIYSIMNASYWDMYYNKKTKAYYNDNSAIVGDHAISIIGWDDSYKKENFKEGHRPSTDGAYIVQNSWGKDVDLEDGVFYISYEDSLIEQEMYGIVSATEIDYDQIYQYDELGRNQFFQVTGSEHAYGANVFERKTQQDEYITEIGISTYCNMDYEIYINAIDGELNSKKLIKVDAEQKSLTSGYHTIKLKKPVKLLGEKFAICIKYIKRDEPVGISTSSRLTEINGIESVYKEVTSKPNQSFMGLTLNTLQDLYTHGYENVNICLKAFTSFENGETDTRITSTQYQIYREKKITIEPTWVISNIKINTTARVLKQNLVTEEQINLYNENQLLEENEIIKSGMKLKVQDGTSYTLIVTGDINSDGKISILDLSQAKAYMVDLKQLTENSLLAFDFNSDGKLTILDLSKLKCLLIGLL